jgi:hypothetical protein
MQGSYFWLRTTRLYTNEKIGSRITKKSLSAFGVTMSYQRKDMGTITSYPKFDEPFGVRFHFENFEGPTSVDVIIVLLVEDDLTLYTMVTIVPTKR